MTDQEADDLMDQYFGEVWWRSTPRPFSFGTILRGRIDAAVGFATQIDMFDEENDTYVCDQIGHCFMAAYLLIRRGAKLP